MTNDTLGTGRISDLIRHLKIKYGVSDIKILTPQNKIDILCQALQLKASQLDDLISSNSPVLRTIKGHTFEVVFEYVLTKNGYVAGITGGDTNGDLIVNGKLLQLKTPYAAGTRGNVVAYKSHKTHGAKSELESEEYYSDAGSFPDYLVGLISYVPFQIIFLGRSDLPTHSKFPNRLLSPFSVTWLDHVGVNAFALLGIDKLEIPADDLKPSEKNELLPKTAELLGIKTDFILNTILRETNFRIWDMNIRGFAREHYFASFLSSHKIAQYRPLDCRRERADKADFALQRQGTADYTFFQMKGLSIGRCLFSGENSTIAVETQLTRGRYNDHPTQSRLYLATDFDFVVFGIDPIVSQKYNTEIGIDTNLHWEFYTLPTEVLMRYPKIPTRINPIQFMKYTDLQEYRVDEIWSQQWAKRLL